VVWSIEEVLLILPVVEEEYSQIQNPRSIGTPTVLVQEVV
jgi:hypothetical protein